MLQKKLILRRITIILLAIISPAFVQAQEPLSAYTLPYIYGFESESLADDGWTLSNPEGSSISAAISTDYHKEGSKSFVFSAAAVEEPATPKTVLLVSPELTVTEASRLLFYYRKKTESHSGTFRIGYSTTGTDAADFYWSSDITSATTGFTSYAYQITTDTKYIAFKFESAAEARSLVLDNLVFSPATCANATAFVCASPFWRGVRLEWTDNSYGYATYVIKNGESVVATLDRGVTSYTFTTELAIGTAHTYTLYTKCGDDVLEDPVSVTFTTSKGPRVDGYVCGGARMADVNGSSRVTVVNCEHLYAVYGANDIAGEVKGQTSHYGADGYKGAEVIVGTENTEQVLIDYVYGGGSGLYYYPGIGTSTTETTGGTSEDIKYSDGITSTGFTRTTGQVTSLRSLSTNGEIKGYYNFLPSSGITTIRENVFATLAVPDGGTFPSIPSVAHTRVSVNSDNVYIDSLFGGAENALVSGSGVAGDTSVSITINGGTIYSLFGGNNYGGFLGSGTFQHVVVNGTKTDPSSSVNLGGEKSTGKSHAVAGNDYDLIAGVHGIRYLFGGGNIVEGQNVHIEINGGQIDTLFGGGNSADVASTEVVVDVTDPIYSSYRADYSPSTSTFDIRCLFSGNNNANMYAVPNLDIRKGGIHNLYGGGNKGLMLGGEDYADNDAVYAHTGEGFPAANAKRSTKIDITGSKVICDTIYGGGQSAGTINDTYIKISSGEYGAIFGGTNILGNIGWQGDNGSGRYQNAQGKWVEYAKTNILMKGGKVNEALFGGSNGYYLWPGILLYTNSRLHQTDAYDYLSGRALPSVWQTNVWIDGGAFYGSIYGGGNIAPVGSINTAAASNAVTADREGNTYVLATNGHQWANTSHPLASLFGGGNYANIYGNTTVVVKGTVNLDNNVYGGNDKTGTVTGGPSRMGSYSSLGSDNVAWDKFPGNMTVSDRHIPLNAQNAPCYVLVEESPYIWGSLYGGGNGYYNYYSYASNGDTVHNTDIPWKSNADGEAPVQEALFCGGSLSYPDQTASFVDLNASPSGYITIMKVFGGGNFATVGKEVTIGTSVFPKGNATVWLNNTSRGSKPSIYSIFGGNNHVDMDAVPRVYLLSGGVSEVYGGGNEGGMTSHVSLGGDYEYEVGTCVILASNDVLIDKNIYGGCNAADVAYDTYVGIFKANIDANIFGGNNVSGNVNNTHILVDGIAGANTTIGGEIFGGGNGNYSYTLQDREPSDPYRYYTNAGYYNGERYSNLTGRPTTDVTSVVVKGEVTMHGNIYGGGLAGGCRQTKVDIDAPDGIFDCTIFGGGKGDISNIGNGASSYNGYADGNPRTHVGNVTGTNAKTEVHIRQMKSMNIDASSHRHAVFGGGYSGDVDGNTYVTLYETNTARIPAVYLGGVAADVSGIATGLFNGYDTPELRRGRTNIVDTIYGGNDFTGRVKATDITINSGVYQHVFGAGNGDYVYHTLLSSSGFSSLDTVPYSMDVKVEYNGGLFRGNVYGGGNMGLVGNRDMEPGDMEAGDAGRFADIGRIHVIINDGDFRRHVFGGARGKSNMKDRFFGTSTGTHNNVDNMHLGRQLVYGLKQVDMYGGEVYFSLHGGSESVDDGYPFECIGPQDANTNFYKPLASRDHYVSGTNALNSTLRPSSIVNIIGGHVRKSLYGGGYQGNIYGSVFVNIGAHAVDDSPVWGARYGSTTAFKDGATTTTFAQMKPANLTISEPVLLDASVYNCADWGEAGDKAYFNTRGVFGGETNVIIDGEGYNTTGDPLYSGHDPEMTIAHSVIGTGTSTEGGDINRLIVMRNYGHFLCPKPLKALYSIQRADKVVLDNVYINLYGEQDAFESYASPNFSLNRIDTLALCNDNVLNIESPANYIGLHASLKGITGNAVYNLTDIIFATSPNLVTNDAVAGVAQTSDNLASNDILDNQVEGTCTTSVNGCDKLDVCALVPTNRGERGRPGKYNTIIIDQGSYMKISPFVDEWDNRTIDLNNDGDFTDANEQPHAGRDGVDDNEDSDASHEHDYGHVFGYTYLVAPIETMGYVYGIYKNQENELANNLGRFDGGFVSPCACNNIDDYFNTDPLVKELGFTNVSDDGPYRTWKIGTPNGLRKRSATLIANKEPDQILNWPLEDGYYTTSYNDAHQSSTNNYPVSNGGNFAYATAAIELPPAKKGNFYIVETIEIDQANGGEMRLIDEGYEAISNSVFKAWQSSTGELSSLASSGQNLTSIANGDHNLSFGLTMSSINGGGMVTNFADYGTCWTGTTPSGMEHPLYKVTEASGPIDRDIAKYTTDEHGERQLTDPVEYYSCWPITSISGGTYFNSIGGYISNAVTSTSGIAEGFIPRIVFTLTYDTRLTNTIARDVKFRMLEYDKNGIYQGPIDVTVTITTVIRDFSDIEAPLLAMYNEGISDKYVRRINIPASFLQRDLYLEDVKWELNTALNAGEYQDQVFGSRFHLQDTNTAITNNTQFAIKVSPVEMVSNSLNNHLGWYDIVEESRDIDLYALAQEDHIRRTGSPLTTGQSVNYTSWDITPDAVSHLDDAEGHYDGTMPSYGHENYTGNTWGDANGSEWYDNRISSSSLHGKEGIKLGTLDGRAPATLDVTLKYDGTKTYHDHYSDGDPGPLAWAYLKLHWYNTNVQKEGDDNDGIFWVKVKLRTREKGDTIYMAPGDELARNTVEGVTRTMRYWNHPSFNRNSSIEDFAINIRNNPDSYVKTFPEALRIYREGDVLDIMETIEIGNDNPLSVGNTDNVGIQIIRYSGSHYKFPSLGCANPNVMVKVNSGGRLAFRNVRFNGSGATRVKKRAESHQGEHYTSSSIYYYNDVADRVKTIYFAESPILQCDAGGQLSLTNDVSLINNYNKASYGVAGFVGGGAVAVTNGGIVSMGNNTVIRDNLVVNNGTILNYGGAVYVDGGVLRVGPQIEDADCKITIEHNYNYKLSESNVLNNLVIDNDTPPTGFFTNAQDEWRHRYILDTAASTNLPSNFSLSNVYLTRTPVTLNASDITAVSTGTTAQEMSNILKVRGDAKNDRIHFTGALSKGSRIGVSKWFPGYRYTSTGSSSVLNNTVPRDTVSIAVLTGSTKESLAEQNFTNNVFFNDSNYFAQTSGTRAFITNNDYTEYHDATAAFPAYNDQVNTFYHNYVDDKTIYLHRCASFGKGVTKRQLEYTAGGNAKTLSDYGQGDSIAFLLNPEATCVAITDTILFKVGGGFFPYTFHWDYDSVFNPSSSFDSPQLYRKGVRDRQTYDPNSISNLDIPSYAAKRLAAERDTLVLYALEERQTLLQSTYFFQATATDAAGCAVTQPVMVRVAKNHESEQIFDNGNFLLYDNDVEDDDYYEVTSSVDSSYFHGRHHNTSTGFTGSSTITPSYKLLDGSADPKAASYASYSGNNVPRYMRTYHSYKVTPQVMPALADDVIDVSAYTTAGGTELNLAVDLLCPGSMIYLTPVKPANSKWEYMSWDFDPSTGENTTFVVSNDPNRNKPTVYYAPGDYWWQVVRTYYNDNADHGANTASKLDYVTDYYGDVTIKTKKGLAWLISVVNGYNGQSAHTFHFNTVTIDPSVSETELDMAAHKWTPIGNQSHPFEGTFVGNGKTVSNLIVNENSLPLVGMFGYTDSASISNLTLTDVQMKGNSYIGSLVGHSNTSNIEEVEVKNGILFSEYVAGGLVGKSEDQTYILNCTISQETGDPLSVKGNAIYFGGIGGEASWTTVINPVTNNIKQDYLSALYSSPYLGTSVSCTTNVAGKQVMRNEIHNGYAHIKSTGNASRLGGLVGRAEALNLYNCYVYGEAKATEFTGALAGYVGSNVDISNCYYVDGLSNQVVGYGTSSSVHKSSAFHGRGKQVLLNDRVDGYNNLLRALNGWVNAQNNPVYKHWRPAVGDENGGYPLFGNPEVIEVFDTFAIAACDSYDFDGITLTQSGTYTMHFVDPDDYLDSTVTIMLTVNYGDTVEVSDTVLLGQPYEGYGITLSADQVREAFGGNMSGDVATMMYIDSLLNANGCDSLIMLTLFIVNNNSDIDNSQFTIHDSQVKIYPNPTRGMVTVEGSGLLSVEVYDNISRRVLDKATDGKAERLRFDMSQQASGSYYIRVKTTHGTVVKKLIKK